MSASFTATRGSVNGSNTAATSLGISPSATLNVDDEIVVVCTLNNTGTTDADDTNEITSVDDNSSQSGAANTYTKLGEVRESSGAADDGAVYAVFLCRLTRSILTSDTITAHYANSRAGRNIALLAFASTNPLQLASGGKAYDKGNDTTPSMALSSLPSKEYVLLGGMAKEGQNTNAVTDDADYTRRFYVQAAGTGSINMSLYIATRIATLTGDNFDLTLASNADWAAALFALEEVASGVSGSAASTLPALTQAASGTVAVAGPASSSLPALTQAASGTVAVAGAAASSLPALTQSAAGTVAVTGPAASSLPALTQAASGTVEVRGAATSTLPSLTQAAAGTAGVSGAVASSLPSLQSAAAGVVAVQGSAASTLPSLASAASGTVSVTGSAASVLPALTGSASGTVAVAGAASSTLPPLEQSAEGIVGSPAIFGAAASVLPALASSAAGVVPVQGAAASVLPALQQAGDGVSLVQGLAASVLPKLGSAASGTVGVAGPAASSLPALLSAALGTVRISGTASSVLPGLVVAATARTVIRRLGMVDSAGPAEGRWRPDGVPEGDWR
jgi:hypothetical protein